MMFIAEWRKTKRTLFRQFIIVLPIIYPILFTLYLWFANWGIFQNEMQMIQGFFAILIVGTQCLSGLLIYLSISIDKSAGNFGVEVRSGRSRIAVMLNKILFLILILGSVVGFATVIFLLLMFWTYSMLFYGNKIIVLVGSIIIFTTPLVILYAYISYRWGSIGVVTTMIIQFLTSLLFGATPLGDKLWWYIPMSWGLKLVKVIPQFHDVHKLFETYL